MKRPTARDVAERAGVSRAAVSFVFSGRAEGNLSARTQQRIKEAADALGYRPDEVARSLRGRRTGVLGMLSDSIATSPFAGRTVLGAMEAARARGHQILLMESGSDQAAASEAIAELRARRVDGFVYAAMELNPTDVPEGLEPDRTVLANCLPRTPGTYAAVVADERAGGRSAVDALLAAGHRDIALIGGPDGNIAADDRTRGFHDGMREAGLPVPDGRVLRVGWQIDEGYAAAARVLASAPPTAVVCANDRVAAGVLLAAARAGLSVPDDLSVVGYDDQDQMAAHLVPALTTVALPHHAMGAAAVHTLLDAVEAGTPVPRTEVSRLNCPLVERDSVARVRG
ncbi:LacI family DNA-binding transcriptional regulator [Streptomyces sp. VRA16 Mangrove soil]|uniref:LacI family DNA-binding transcriptional regulator n=1 Tax=Streptomyces sp. VRA16 Mangrove soil TaxID=2817434 RepID=UPI001A9E052E|nr:LacI family DNA-binding transcriptional regulator [Streptomyces sp. VRA16 Mangrove soil]MBO1330050.1 LacI family DNA-binding transcriptional regulator [Streptomyces sp. VRA16 Mangrove soil]